MPRRDVAAILDDLGLDQFVTLGWSGGGPHALACAALLPDRCRAAASLAGVAPFDAEGLDFLAGMGPENVEEFGAAADSARRAGGLPRADARRAGTTSPGEEIADALGGLVDDVDRAALTGELADVMARMFRRALSFGPRRLARRRPRVRASRGASTSPRSPCRCRSGRAPRTGWCRSRTASGSPRTSPAPASHLYDDEGHISLAQQLPRILDDAQRHLSTRRTRSAQPAAIRSSGISRTLRM